MSPEDEGTPGQKSFGGLVTGAVLWIGSLWLFETKGEIYYAPLIIGVVSLLAGVFFGAIWAVKRAASHPVWLSVGLGILAGVGVDAYLRRDVIEGLLSDKTQLGARYVDSRYGFSLEYPKGWTGEGRHPYRVWGYAPRDTPRDVCNESFGVIVSERSGGAGETLEGWFRSGVERKRAIPTFREVETGNLRLRNTGAKYLVYTLGGGHRVSVVAYGNGKGYELEGDACPDTFERDVAAFKDIAQTFRLETAR